MADDDTPLRLSREDLYELAWSKPISQLAKDFGISDVALAKRCRRLGIPLPGRGYWARVDAGQAPYRPKLPKRETQWHEASALTVGPSIGAYGVTLALLEGEIDSARPGRESVSGRIAAQTIVPSTSLLAALPAVKRTAKRWKHPRRSDLTFLRGERSGSVVALNVTDEVLERALLLADTLLRAAESLGWVFDVPQVLAANEGGPSRADRSSPSSSGEKLEGGSCTGRLLVEGEQIEFRIEERFRDEPCEPSASELAREKREYGYHAPRKVSVATGALRLVRLGTYRAYGGPDRRSWYDRRGKAVEEQIPEVLLGFYDFSLSIKERRTKDEREAREREEQERRRKEWADIQDANQKLITQLETDAGAWHRARYLRRYIYAARRQLGGHRLRAKFREEIIDFLDVSGDGTACCT